MSFREQPENGIEKSRPNDGSRRKRSVCGGMSVLLAQHGRPPLFSPSWYHREWFMRFIAQPRGLDAQGLTPVTNDAPPYGLKNRFGMSNLIQSNVESTAVKGLHGHSE